MSDSEIITLGICSEVVGIDSEKAWYSFVKRNYRHLFPDLCCRTRFNRTRRNLLQVTELLRQKLPLVFPIPVGKYYVIDSFPLPVCKFGRARFFRSFRTDGANYGKCPSKKETYYDFKVHAMITLEGYITAFEITPASTDDLEGLRDLAENHLNLVIPGDHQLCAGHCFRKPPAGRKAGLSILWRCPRNKVWTPERETALFVP